MKATKMGARTNSFARVMGTGATPAAGVKVTKAQGIKPGSKPPTPMKAKAAANKK